MSGKKQTASRIISRGCGEEFLEAPHIYLIDGWYYLMLAEGGTEYGHMVTMQRSRSVYGPYELCPNNPILTHRNCSGHPIQGKRQNNHVLKQWEIRAILAAGGSRNATTRRGKLAKDDRRQGEGDHDARSFKLFSLYLPQLRLCLFYHDLAVK
jgi:beta-xylosidase